MNDEIKYWLYVNVTEKRVEPRVYSPQTEKYVADYENEKIGNRYMCGKDQFTIETLLAESWMLNLFSPKMKYGGNGKAGIKELFGEDL